MCQVYLASCASCTRVIKYVQISRCLDKYGSPCLGAGIIFCQKSSRICHYCDLSKWRMMSKACELLHNMRCRDCGKRDHAMRDWDKVIQDALANYASLSGQERLRLEFLRTILAGEVVWEDELDNDEDAQAYIPARPATRHDSAVDAQRSSQATLIDSMHTRFTTM